MIQLFCSSFKNGVLGYGKIFSQLFCIFILFSNKFSWKTFNICQRIKPERCGIYIPNFGTNVLNIFFVDFYFKNFVKFLLDKECCMKLSNLAIHFEYFEFFQKYLVNIANFWKFLDYKAFVEISQFNNI